MSSKNPFRQSIQQQTASSSSPTASLTAPDLSSSSEQRYNNKDASFANAFDVPQPTDPEQRRSSKAKRVRIQTPPPLSPESTRNSLIIDESLPVVSEPEGRYLGTLPSDVSSEDSSDSPVDVSSESLLGDGTLEQFQATQEGETLQHSRSKSPDVGQERLGSASTVANPFQRTLATMDPSNTYKETQREAERKVRHNAEAEEKTSRTPMDVDEFKRLLLTGQTSQRPLNEAIVPQTTPLSHVAEKGGETVRSSTQSRSGSTVNSEISFDASGRSIGSHISDFDEGQGSQRGGKRPAPPPPKPRHGRPVLSSTSTLAAPVSLSESDFGNSSSAAIDLPPPLSPTSARSKPDLAALGEQSQIQPSVRHEQKARPPAPPLARRTSNRSPSSIPTVAPPSTETPKPSQATGRVPPPPPARRSAASASALAGAGTLVRQSSDASTRSPNGTEALPVSGRPRSSSRSSSIMSNRTMPPPLPPSRRRGSSRSSLDGPSPADERPGKRSSVEMDRLVEETRTTDADGKNWLADMDAFQAEVDALRTQYGDVA